MMPPELAEKLEKEAIEFSPLEDAQFSFVAGGKFMFGEMSKRDDTYLIRMQEYSTTIAYLEIRLKQTEKECDRLKSVLSGIGELAEMSEHLYCRQISLRVDEALRGGANE